MLHFIGKPDWFLYELQHCAETGDFGIISEEVSICLDGMEIYIIWNILLTEVSRPAIISADIGYHSQLDSVLSKFMLLLGCQIEHGKNSSIIFMLEMN